MNQVNNLFFYRVLPVESIISGEYSLKVLFLVNTRVKRDLLLLSRLLCLVTTKKGICVVVKYRE